MYSRVAVPKEKAIGPLHPVYRRLLVVVNHLPTGVHAAFGGLRPRFSFTHPQCQAAAIRTFPTDRQGVEDRRWACQRVILQLGRACWSLATPASVTLVRVESSIA